ncbi:MAG: O-methyltransferase [Halodesulfurarchaeum sp.]
MGEFLSDTVETLISLGNPDPHPVLAEMTEHGRERGFPTVGPAVGQFLAVAADMIDADRVFELGSGFGYSAAWFAQALGPDGEIVLTDYREENLERAMDFFDRLNFEGRARFEQGDATDILEAVDGRFDIVLIDLEKREYPDAWETVRSRVPDGGLIIADNMMGGPVTPEGVTSALEGEETGDEATRGVATYIKHVRADAAFRSALVPLGEGIAISLRTG